MQLLRVSECIRLISTVLHLMRDLSFFFFSSIISVHVFSFPVRFRCVACTAFDNARTPRFRVLISIPHIYFSPTFNPHWAFESLISYAETRLSSQCQMMRLSFNQPMNSKGRFSTTSRPNVWRCACARRTYRIRAYWTRTWSLNYCGCWLGVWTLVGNGKVSNSITGYNVARGLGCASYSRGLLSERWLRAVYDLDAFTIFLMAMIYCDQESGQPICRIKTFFLVSHSP